MTETIIALPGITRNGDAFIRALWDLAASKGWSADNLATIMYVESGFRPDIRNPQPGQTATGLIQFIEATARSLGTTTAALAAMSAVEQLEYVRRYYERAFGARTDLRRVDYYAVVWGARAGLPFDHILARQGQKVYDLNKGLDVNSDGLITIGDLDQKMARAQSAAKGVRLAVPPLASPEQARVTSCLRLPCCLDCEYFVKRGNDSGRD